MSWLKSLPAWMVQGPQAKEGQTDESPPSVVSSAIPTPLHTVVVGGSTTHDKARTDAIVEALVDAVPRLRDLFGEADKVKDDIPDVRTRMAVVMRLKGIGPQGATDIVAGLKSAFIGVQQTGEAELQAAKTSKIDGPKEQIARNDERKAMLMQEIATLERQTGELRQSVDIAVQEIAHETGLFQASLAQAQVWIGTIAEQLGIKN